MSKVLVIGSSNTDLVIKTSHFPVPGETVLGGDFYTFAGGKGANQAVAACRLGAEVFFAARVGEDDFGTQAIEGYEREGIITSCILRDAELPTGVASIIIDKEGEISIIVAPGANNKLSKADIDGIVRVIEIIDVMLVQLEVPVETIGYAMALAHSKGKRVILNPAPAAVLDHDLFKYIEVITPNETETELLLGIKLSDVHSYSQAAQIFLDKGVKNVIITLGAKGVFFKNKEQEFMIPACKTTVVDTTAAGDTFNGALAVAMTEGKDWKKAIEFSNRAAAISVSRLGAQPSVPTRTEVDAFL